MRRTTIARGWSLRATIIGVMIAALVSGCGMRTGSTPSGAEFGALNAGSKKRPRPHEGTDYMAPRGTKVIAPGDGIVTKAIAKIAKADRRKWFHCHHELQIKHTGRTKGISTRYCHLGDLYVNFGDEVKEGQVIATIGQCAMGPPQCPDHLHFEVVEDWVRKDPETKIGGCYSKGEEVLTEDRPLYHPLKC